MNKKFRNWKIILNTNNYHSIFIKNDSLWLFYEYIDEISEIDDYLILLPSYKDKKENQTSGLITKLAPQLKAFLEGKDKKTLIIDEEVLSSLLKEDKRENFFRFLAKQKKNVIVFCHSDYERYVGNIARPYNYMVMDYEMWRNSLEVFDRFLDIKVAVSKTYNPFKSPSYAFKRYKEEQG